jgi:error-prone DNA polymerase
MAEQDALLEPPPRRIQFPPQAAGPASGMAAGPGLPGYAELHCLSNFSFLRGASSPAELVQRAKALGYQALALTDEPPCAPSRPRATAAWR